MHPQMNFLMLILNKEKANLNKMGGKKTSYKFWIILLYGYFLLLEASTQLCLLK